MTVIKGKGKPTKNTKGSIGAIYIDTDSGSKYKCTSSYSCHTLKGVTEEYEWEPTVQENVKPAVSKPVKEPEKPTANEETSEPVKNNGANKQQKQKQNYTQYYNKK